MYHGNCKCKAVLEQNFNLNQQKHYYRRLNKYPHSSPQNEDDAFKGNNSVKVYLPLTWIS